MPPTRFPARTALALGAVGTGVAAYAAAEARAYTLRRFEVPALPAGHAPLRVLHLSDLHLTPDQRAKREWVRRLADLEPDLVVDTGDNLASLRALPPLLDALGPLLDVPGVFVLGSNDYFAPGFRNPLRYLLPDDGKRNTRTEQLPWREMKAAMSAAGWLDLTNTGGAVRVRGTELRFVGVDDPHLSYDDLAAVRGGAAHDGDVRIAVAHAPYLRVLDAFAADDHDLVLAGHTHGGQVCLPYVGALTTNCDLETARAKGLHRHPADSAPGDPGSSVLHVSAGLGTNPWLRFRTACRPEASLLTLVPRQR
ncbi:metallophosphoesterase [Nocardioides sp. CFH 31398]|uniref:metallophosphoesterase n=1 Tax=Nocardioides sp. CFH 31398 TaxID=2919579 RepID=UPI001F065182|nr:metallophosphoesterase [Nocardioides sp. CFH 31398]MCH1867837.1 metallophosphoesterase [Nocardioides sp. CFH 31398]